MNIVDNKISGQKATGVSCSAATGDLAGAEAAAPNGHAPLHVDISWQVAPAQIVAILDSSAIAGEHSLPALAPVVLPVRRECNA